MCVRVGILCGGGGGGGGEEEEFVAGQKQPLGAVCCRLGSSTVVINSISLAICLIVQF